MDILKNISFSIALFVIGAIFVFLGLSGGFIASSYSFTIHNVWLRAVSVIVGGALVAVAIYLEIKSRPPTTTTKETAQTKSPTSSLEIRPTAEGFFYTLDDRDSEGFTNMVKEAVRVRIMGRTTVNLLGQYERVFEQLGKSGCEIHLLFVDPSCEAAKFLYGSNPEVYRSNIISASQHLQRLKGVIGHQLQVRVTKHAPTLSIIIVEKKDLHQGFLQTQLYFLHSALGRDRPIFRVSYNDKWYGIFRDEFTQLWSASVEWDVSRFLNTGDKEG
jgi:hypothetical protein